MALREVHILYLELHFLPFYKYCTQADSLQEFEIQIFKPSPSYTENEGQFWRRIFETDFHFFHYVIISGFFRNYIFFPFFFARYYKKKCIEQFCMLYLVVLSIYSNMVIYQKKKAEASKLALKGITVKHKDSLQVFCCTSFVFMFFMKHNSFCFHKRKRIMKLFFRRYREKMTERKM